jgi:uncharacterized protein (TIGR02246 family)
MQYSIRIGTLLCVAMLASMTFAQQTPEEASAALTQKWIDAWAKGDTAAISDLYTEDADLLGSNGKMVSGRSEIEAYLNELKAGPFAGTTLSVGEADMRCISETTCISDSSYTFSGGEPEMSGLTTIVMVNQGGEWRIAAHRSRVPVSSGP